MTLDDPAGIAAAICRRRLTAWEILAGLSERSEDWAAHLPERLTGLTGAAGWLQEEWRPDGVLLLEGLVRRAERRGTADLEDLALDSAVAAGPLLGRMHAAVRGLADLCRAELSCWESGASEEAKALRVEQMALLLPQAPVRTTSTSLAAARVPVWSPVAATISAYVTLETGR